MAEPRKDRASEAEPQTYDLAEPEPSPRTPAKPARPAPRRSDPAPGETYELADEQPRAAPRGDVADRLARDPRFTSAAPSDAAVAPDQPAVQPQDPGKPRVKTSVYTPEAEEPAYVSPEVAAARREEARVRAAALQAEADTRRRRLWLIVAAVVAVTALIGVALSRWF